MKYEIKIGTFFQRLDQDFVIDWKNSWKKTHLRPGTFPQIEIVRYAAKCCQSMLNVPYSEEHLALKEALRELGLLRQGS